MDRVIDLVYQDRHDIAGWSVVSDNPDYQIRPWVAIIQGFSKQPNYVFDYVFLPKQFSHDKKWFWEINAGCFYAYGRFPGNMCEQEYRNTSGYRGYFILNEVELIYLTMKEMFCVFKPKVKPLSEILDLEDN